MKVLELRKSYQLQSIIEIVSKYIRENNNFTNDNYCLYTETDVDFGVLELVCYIEEGATITDNDEEIYPDFVQQKSLNFFYDGNQFEDVLLNVQHQKSDATIDDYILALDYYAKYDTFKDFRCW